MDHHSSNELFLRSADGQSFLKLKGSWLTKVKFVKSQTLTLVSLDTNYVQEQHKSVILKNYSSATKEEFVNALRKAKQVFQTTYHSHL